MSACAARFEELGCRLVCVVKENLAGEVDAFRALTWPDPLPVVMDGERAFFKAIGGGEVVQWSLSGFLAAMLNPWGGVRRNMTTGGAAAFAGGSNNTGEGFGAGGLYVVKKGGAIQYAFLEDPLGQHAPLEKVLKAAAEAAA